MERIIGMLLLGGLMVAVIFATARLSIQKSRTRREDRVNVNGAAYVDSWGSAPHEDSVNSVRVGGIGPGSLGKELRVRVMDRQSGSTLDALSWKINSPMSPDLTFEIPIPPDSIGAVLIAIE